MYIKTNGILSTYSISELRADNPQVSFPKEIPDSILAEFGVYPLKSTTQTTCNTATERVEEGTPVQQDGKWVQVWNVVSLTAEEMQQRNDAKANSVRIQRGELLVASDWTQIDDSPLDNIKKAEWATYRQALRDITIQEGFPWEINWPTKP